MLAARHTNLVFLLSVAPLACAVGDVNEPGPLSQGSFGSNGDSATNGAGSTGSQDDDSQDDNSDTPNDSPDDDPSGPVDEGPLDEGPLDEGPLDEGPLDEGPLDEGPLDEGPLDDSMDDLTDGASAEGPMDTGGGYSGDACMGYAANAVYCFGGDPNYYEGLCLDVIDYYYASYGPGCAAAAEDLFACIAGVDCREFVAGAGCDAEIAALMAAC